MNGFWDKVNRSRETFQQRRELKLGDHGVLKLRNILAMHPNPHIRNAFFNQVWMSTQMAAIDAELHPPPVTIPAVSPEKAVPLGQGVTNGQRIEIDIDVQKQPTVISGATGCGKTTVALGILRRVCELERMIKFIDHKGGEGNRLPAVFDDVIVFEPHQLTQNLWEPPVADHAELFFATSFNNLGSAYSLMPSNFLHAPGIMMRVTRGLTENSERPSSYDIANILRSIGRTEQQKFGTTALAIDAFNVPLKKAAYIRRGVTPAHGVQVFKWFGLPHRAHQFLSAQLLLIARMEALAKGFTSTLRQLIYSDEGLFEFGKRAQHASASGYLSTAELYSTQMRAYGFGIMVSVQSLADLDESVLSNCGTLVVMRTPNTQVAKFAAELLQLPAKFVEVIQTLPVGQGFVRSIGFSGAVLVQFPFVDAGRYVSNEEIDESMKPKFAALEQHIVRAPVANQQASPIFFDGTVPQKAAEAVPRRPAQREPEIPLRVEHIAFMRDVAAHGDSTTADRYCRLGLSAGRGNRIKDDLNTIGFVTSRRRYGENGRPAEVLGLTEAGTLALREAKP